MQSVEESCMANSVEVLIALVINVACKYIKLPFHAACKQVSYLVTQYCSALHGYHEAYTFHRVVLCLCYALSTLSMLKSGYASTQVCMWVPT